MFRTFRNLLHVLKRFKLATLTNLIGLTLAFLAFIVIKIHVDYEYGFDSSIPNRERIFQMENLRDDGVWESNFARPQLERFIASSPFIEAAAITKNDSYSSSRVGISANPGQDGTTYMEKIEWIRPGFTDVFHFHILSGSEECINEPGNVLISEKQAKKIFGEANAVGKEIFLPELNGIGASSRYADIPSLTVGGVYRDFPENTRLQNVLYLSIPDNERIDDWITGSYYGYVLLSSPDVASAVAEQYMSENAAFLKQFSIYDIRLRPVPELYFGQQARADAGPTGSRLRTNMLFFISILVILIALINYINLSVALAPVRIKSINTQKVLGCSQSLLQKNLLFESLGISLFAYLLALLLLFLFRDNTLVEILLGHSLNLSSNRLTMLITGILAIGMGLTAGIYPALYITSFPPIMALNGSFSLTGKAKLIRKTLIGFQYVISITLVIGAFFIFLQNKYIEKADLGYDRENILEVKLSIGTASTKSSLYRDRLLEHPNIKDVGFQSRKFVSDESTTLIGYHYQAAHSYIVWRGVSANFPELMGVTILAGRDFLPGDELTDSDKAVCMINEAAANDIMARLSGEGPQNIHELIGTNIMDENTPVEIVGVFKDFHFESLYKEVRPFAFWVSAPNTYRRTDPEIYSYVKIAGGNPRAAIGHIHQVTDDLNPGYPADIQFFDQALNNLYEKSRIQGFLVTLFCLLAVLLSLVGVFGLVIFESEGREKEIAIRKVFGATVRQILWMLNHSFMKVVAAGFILAAPLGYYGVNQWLKGFAYKTPVHLWVFIVALLLITLLTALTVTFQSYQVATSNPSGKLHK